MNKTTVGLASVAKESRELGRAATTLLNQMDGILVGLRLGASNLLLVIIGNLLGVAQCARVVADDDTLTEDGVVDGVVGLSSRQSLGTGAVVLSGRLAKSTPVLEVLTVGRTVRADVALPA